MNFDFDFFSKDLVFNKILIKEEIDKIKNQYFSEKESFDNEFESFCGMNKEEQLDFRDIGFSPFKKPIAPIVLSQDIQLNDPYFFFCTDEDILFYQSSLDINIKFENKKIVRFTDYRARHLRFRERSGNNKFNIFIRNGILEKVEPILNEPIDTYDITHLLRKEETITIHRKKTSSGMGDISRLMKQEQDEIMGAPIEGITLVKGVAGSGKTNILLHRIQYLLWEHSSIFSQEKILFLCYNVSLKKYIHSMIERNFPKIDVQTIDKWQKDVFEKYVGGTYPIKDQTIANRKEIENIINKFIFEITDISQYVESKEYSKIKIKKEGTKVRIKIKINLGKILQKLFGEIKEYSKYHVYTALSLFSKTTIRQKNEAKDVFISIWGKDFLYKHSNTNYTEVTYFLDKPSYDHIFIDEVQDLSDVQINIFNGFHKNSMTLAGDETQLLSGKTPKTLEDSLGIYIDRQYFLGTSHRNSLQTATFANEILKNVSIKSSIQKIGFSGLKPVIKTVNDINTRNKYLIDKIKDLVFNEPKSSICITCPKDTDLDEINTNLKKAGIDSYIAKNQERDFDKKIHITKYYQAKGLEFDYMFILGINDFLGWTNRPNKENVFYTIVTRAIKRVYVPIIGELPKLIKDIDKNTYDLQQ